MRKGTQRAATGRNDLRAEELALQALELPAEKRRAFILQATEEDPELRESALAALQGEASLDGFLEDSPVPRPATEAPRSQPPPRLGMGEVIGDFRVIRLLGEGGFANVYLAKQLSLDREVALKVFPERQQHEARILAQLEHDHIVKIHSETSDRERGLRIICMQYVPGATLSEIISRWKGRGTISGASLLADLRDRRSRDANAEIGKMSADSPLRDLDFQEVALWIGREVAMALAYAHGRGVLHLDVKPSNILMSVTGRAYLTDFNVSLDAHSREDGPKVIGGTFQYMAPEQKALIEAAKRRQALPRVDHRADIYSLGLVLREFLEEAASPGRRRAGASKNENTIVLKDVAVLGEKRGQSSDWRGIDVGVRLAVEQCTHEDPDERFPTAEMAKEAFTGCLELRAIVKSLPPAGRLVSWSTHFPSLGLTACWLLPSLLATATVFAYRIWILTALVSGSLPWGALARCGLVYLPLLAFCAARLRSIVRILKSPGSVFRQSRNGSLMRRRLLHFPRWLLICATLIWLPGSFAAFSWEALARDFFSTASCGQILYAVTVAGSTAFGYAGLLMADVLLRAMYPRFLYGDPKNLELATGELEGFQAQMRVYYVLVSLAPMAAAAIAMIDPGQSGVVRSGVVGGLLGMGLIGILLSSRVSNRVARLVYAFSSGRVRV